MARRGQTSMGAAAVRALEGWAPPGQRLFEDPVVGRLLPAAARFALGRRWCRESFAAWMERSAPGIRGALLCRTRWIDDQIERALAELRRPVILLGAGLDTRAYRLTSLKDERVIEIDLPAVQRAKRQRLTRVLGALPSRVSFVETDFNVEPLGEALVRSGLRADEPAFFVWEGVTQYLMPEAVDAVLRLLASRPTITEVVFTYVLDEVVSRRFRLDRSEAFRRAATRSPEPWLFGIDPARLGDYLGVRGLHLREDVGADEHVARLVRPLGRDLPVAELERIARASN